MSRKRVIGLGKAERERRLRKDSVSRRRRSRGPSTPEGNTAIKTPREKTMTSMDDHEDSGVCIGLRCLLQCPTAPRSAHNHEEIPPRRSCRVHTPARTLPTLEVLSAPSSPHGRPAGVPPGCGVSRDSPEVRKSVMFAAGCVFFFLFHKLLRTI